jgi:hypothetical protein
MITCVRNVAPAPELCDGLDNNCNGQTDEGNPGGGGMCATGMPGPCAAGTVTCTSGALTCVRDVAPTTEVCDAIDNDCDGSIDNGIPLATCGVGGCARTGTSCMASSCTPGTPGSEVCDGVDNDCDGMVDNGVPLATCGMGACARTGTSCMASSCTPGSPSSEVCDGVDNDCDGMVDNGVPLATCGMGACARTGTSCMASSCSPGAPSAETCDGVDNDCDGMVDNGLPLATCGMGACARTGTSCMASSCSPGTPSSEICDNLDNNCNGSTDEGVTQSCYTGPAGTNGVGVCHGGTQTCTTGTFGSCSGQVVPTTEVCNGTDDNCNGTVDEGVKTTYYRDGDADGYGNPAVTTQACTQPAGYVANNADCDDTRATVHPGAAETCNGIDDNCSGVIDEGVKTTYFADADGDGFGNPSVNTQACTRPTGYVTSNTDCNDTNNAVHPGATEVCNGIDDNCNGSVDEGNPGGGVACGACNQGTTLCVSPALTCTNANAGLATYYRDADGDGYGNPAVTTQACSQPAGYVTNATDCADNNPLIHPGATEACNRTDDNCNGTVDEGNPGGGVACDTSMPGICGAGTTVCSSGTLRCNPNRTPTTETCNSLDDNCDGVVDNAVVPDGNASTCANANSVVVSVPPGGLADRSGYIDTTDDWFEVSFTGVGGSGSYYHPMITFVTNPGPQFRLQVFTACGTPASGCTGNLSTYEMSYPADPNSCNEYSLCTDSTPRVTVFYVHVLRVLSGTGGSTCEQYTVRASNQ